MKLKQKNTKTKLYFDKDYWLEAAKQFSSSKMITIAALIVALRVVVKLFKVNIASGLGFSLDGYVNSLGSMVYGPLVGLAVGAISDILGLILTGQIGTFFPPFTLVEMTSSFIFALFFWKKRINVSRALAAKFSVNLVCNIIMTSIFMKWLKFIQGGPAAAESYKMINSVRIAKNLIMFPLEAMIIITVLSFALPILTRLKLVDKNLCFVEKSSQKELVLKIVFFTLLSVFLVVSYIVLSDNLDFNFQFEFNNVFKDIFK